MNPTLKSSTQRHSTLFASGSMAMGPRPKHYRRGDGSLVVEKQAVFRSGTFRDSMGSQSTWEQLHVDQMVANHNLLKGRNLLNEIPVRDGHPGFLISGLEGTGKVVGWHTDLEVHTVDTDKGKTSYLLASYVLTEPDAADKYERGTYRNRSSEIGTYVTNDEAEFWPAYMGFAFVDIPAVEGLNNVEFSKSSAQSYAGQNVIFLFDRENPLTTPSVTPQSSVIPPILPVALQQPTQQHAQQPQAPAPVVAPQAFMLNGQSNVDAGQIQAHITTLETFRNETLEAARVDFVSSLVSSGKLMASQQESMGTFAKGLSAEQFASWKNAMDAAPQISVLGLHGAPTQQSSKPQVGGEPDAKTSELMSARAIVRMHELAGKSKDFIQGTASYQTIQRLEGTAS
jgi:hypothetical protein